MNLKKFNNLAKEHNLKLIQGNGYLFWDYIDSSLVEDFNPPPSIYVAKFNQLLLSYKNDNRPIWEIELEDAINHLKQEKK